MNSFFLYIIFIDIYDGCGVNLLFLMPFCWFLGQSIRLKAGLANLMAEHATQGNLHLAQAVANTISPGLSHSNRTPNPSFHHFFISESHLDYYGGRKSLHLERSK
jgi:hypothetical protein